MNSVFLLAKQQYLLARRSLLWGDYFSLIYILIMLPAFCLFFPYKYLLVSIPLATFFANNILSSFKLRNNYEFDAGMLSIYPISQQKKFGILLLTDFLHINGVALLLSLLSLIAAAIYHSAILEFIPIISAFIIYWILFSALLLCLRTLCRRNYTYYYIIQFSGSTFVLAVFIFSKRKDLAFINQFSGVSPSLFILCSLIGLPVIYFLLTQWFAHSLQRHPFADELLLQRYVNRKRRT